MSNVISPSLLKFFSKLNHSRQTTKIRYPLPENIPVALYAALCKADSFAKMEAFGNAKLDFLRSILFLKMAYQAMIHSGLFMQILTQSNILKCSSNVFYLQKKKSQGFWQEMKKLSDVLWMKISSNIIVFQPGHQSKYWCFDRLKLT